MIKKVDNLIFELGQPTWIRIDGQKCAPIGITDHNHGQAGTVISIGGLKPTTILLDPETSVEIVR